MAEISDEHFAELQAQAFEQHQPTTLGELEAQRWATSLCAGAARSEGTGSALLAYMVQRLASERLACRALAQALADERAAADLAKGAA